MDLSTIITITWLIDQLNFGFNFSAKYDYESPLCCDCYNELSIIFWMIDMHRHLYGYKDMLYKPTKEWYLNVIFDLKERINDINKYYPISQSVCISGYLNNDKFNITSKEDYLDVCIALEKLFSKVIDIE